MSTWEGGPLLDYPSTCIRVPEQRGEMRMATLSVLKFNDPNGADRVLIALQGLQEREMITLQDAAVLSWPQGKKKPTTRQLHSTGEHGRRGRDGWRFLGFSVRADLLRALPRRGDRGRDGSAYGFDGRRWDRR